MLLSCSGLPNNDQVSLQLAMQILMYSFVKLPYLAYLLVYHIFLQILLQHLSGIHVWRAQLDTPNQQHSMVKNSLLEFYRQVASEQIVPEQLHVWVTITELCKWQLQDRYTNLSQCKVVHECLC